MDNLITEPKKTLSVSSRDELVSDMPSSFRGKPNYKIAEDVIKIRGARQHNLKNVDLDIPKNKLVCFTGVSGSGKSSLAFDTIYAEGQRRYVESLSTYARQFLGVMEKPDADSIEGLSPAISIDQKTTSRNPRSTVGTVTEVYDYLRLLFARVGHPHCPICGREISSQSLDEIVTSVIDLITNLSKENPQVRLLLLSPIVVDKKGEFSSLFDNLRGKGFRQIRVDGHVKDLADDFVLIKTNKHSIDAVIDRLTVTMASLKDKVALDNLKSRLSDSLQQALALSDGLAIISEVKDVSFEMPALPKDLHDHLFSEKFACPIDNIQIPEIEPRTFSFNSPHGACPTCSGIGKILKTEPDLVFSGDLSVREGGILPFGNMFENDTWYARLILTVCDKHGIDAKAAIKDLKDEERQLLLDGTGPTEYRVEGTNRFGKHTYIYENYKGIVAELENRYKSTESDWTRGEIEKYMRETICPKCHGARLKKEALSITINGLSISEVTNFAVEAAQEWVNKLSDKSTPLTERESFIANAILREITSRLEFLISVGLEYLTLQRSAATLSGGEAQRIRLASQIGSGLTGVLYVLDEPTIGLHQRDNFKLIQTLKSLRDLGNTVIVVEHDEETIRESDYIVDFGPHAGKHGGEVVAEGSLKDIINSKESLTGAFLAGKRRVQIKNGDAGVPKGWVRQDQISDSASKSTHYPLPTSHNLTFFGCTQFNLKNIDVTFPLGKFVVITGVSGSGKSTLLVETVYPALMQALHDSKVDVGEHRRMEGVEDIDKVVLIDQSPIGRTPRSNPATYTKVFDAIRDVYASTKDARIQGFKKGRFSFNVKGGRCEACEGQGQTKIEMQFMSDIWVTCEVCHGMRYNSQTLEVNYKGKNIAEVLKMTVEEAAEFFHAHPTIISKIETLRDVGLNYVELGQPATTLSGGEAQRVKLATELAKRETGKTVYILDEPTTGLHFADIQKLLQVLKTLVVRGNSVFVIEHNLDVIRNADWIIDLGPEGGDKGGEVIAKGTVEDIVENDESYTAQYLRKS